MSKKFTRRDAVSIAGVGALAAGGAAVGAGIGQYLDEQNKSKAKSQAEAFNNPSESSVAELRQKTTSIATEAPTANPSVGSSSVPADAAMSNEADGIEHLPDDTTPGLGEEPKSLNWREIPRACNHPGRCPARQTRSATRKPSTPCNPHTGTCRAGNRRAHTHHRRTCL